MIWQTRRATPAQEPWSTRASLQCTYYICPILFPTRIQRVFDSFDFDFYLQAHAGLQGHVRPMHYTVLYDECRLGADEVQQGINTASYLYARATRSVSLVPPVYYAHLACRRGRCYLNHLLVSEDKTTTTSNGEGKARDDKEEEEKKVFDAATKAWGNGIHPNLAGSMFYI